MATSSAPPELLQSNDVVLGLNKSLEKMIESVENQSVQLTWMTYDVVALRTRPQLAASRKKLEEAFHRCRAAVSGRPEPEPEMGKCPDATASTLTE